MRSPTDDWYEKLPKPSYCSTCYGEGVTEKDVPVIDYVNGGYIETRYEPCQECRGDG